MKVLSTGSCCSMSASQVPRRLSSISVGPGSLGTRPQAGSREAGEGGGVFSKSRSRAGAEPQLLVNVTWGLW